MRSYEEYRKILTLWEKGTPKKTISTVLSIPRRTIIDCIQRYSSLEGLEEYIEENPTTRLISTLQTAELSEHPHLFQTYAYLLGIYLGDGCISFSTMPVLVVFAAGLVSLDWEFAYWFPNPGKLRRVKVRIVTNTGRIINCFVL